MDPIDSEGIVKARRKITFADCISSLPSRIKLLMTACPFQGHGLVEFRVSDQTLQYDRELNAFQLAKLFSFITDQPDARRQYWDEYCQLKKLCFTKRVEEKKGILGKSPNSVFTYILLTYLVLAMVNAKRWCESINGAEITTYVSDVVVRNSPEGQLLARAFCSCGPRINLDGIEWKHCKVEHATANTRG